MAALAYDFLMKKHFTTENFTLLQKILLHVHEKYFIYKTCVN